MPNYEERSASLPNSRSAPAQLPGGWQAALIAAISALVAGYWAHAKDAAAGAASANISQVAEVAPQDVTAALDTLDGPPEQLAKFRDREACNPLAWVTVMRSPGQPPGRIRLQSGNYFSPAFELEDAPVRVALPYPAPYPAGRGTISVLGGTTEAIVALTPPWHVPAQGGVHAREVTWIPSGCPRAGK